MPPLDGAVGESGDALDERIVLFITGFTDFQSKLGAWLPELETVFASTASEAYSDFNSSVAVICVSDNQLNDELEQFRTDVLARHPFCQFVAIESEPLANDYIDDYDVILSGPVSKEKLRTAVQQRLKYEVYSSLLQEYYLMNMRAIAIRQLQGEEAVPDYIPERLEQLCPRLEAMRTYLSEDQIREITRTVERHRDYLNQPTQEPSDGDSSKYHPGTCPECGLVWGRDHRNELGRGFKGLGAGVWMCNRCEEIVHALHDSNQRVMKG